jgi:hypothetical protein
MSRLETGVDRRQPVDAVIRLSEPPGGMDAARGEWLPSSEPPECLTGFVISGQHDPQRANPLNRRFRRFTQILREKQSPDGLSEVQFFS